MERSQLKADLGRNRQPESLGIKQWLLQGGQRHREEKDNARWGPCAPYEYDQQFMMLERGEKEVSCRKMCYFYLALNSSATTELNKTHTWFIFGLPPLHTHPPPPKLIYGAIVLYSDLTHQKL